MPPVTSIYAAAVARQCLNRSDRGIVLHLKSIFRHILIEAQYEQGVFDILDYILIITQF